MVIQQIGLKNFRNYEDSVVTLGARSLVIGENGSGKSTLIDAIAWVLTGRCRGVDGKGAGQKELIRAGADQMDVTLDTDTLGRITRSLHRAGSVVTSMKPETIQAKLGVSADMLLAVLYGGTFFQLHHSEAKALLMGLLNVTIQPADVPALQATRPLTLDELEAEYQKAFTARAVLKKQVTATAATITPWVPQPNLDALDPDHVRTNKAVAAKAWEAAIRDRSGADTALAIRTTREAGLLQLIEAQPRLEGQLQVHQDTLAGHQQAAAAARADLKAVEDERAEGVDTLQASVAELKLTVGKLERHDPERGCILSAAIPCHTQATEFTGHIQGIRSAIADLDKRIKAGTKRAETLAQLRQKVKDEDRQVLYHQTQADKIQVALGTVTTAAADLAALRLDIQAVEADLGAKTKAAAYTEMVMQDAAILHEGLSGYLAERRDHDNGLARLTGLQADLATAEALVDLLGPKGIRARVLATALGDFEGLINAALGLFGFSLAIQVEPFDVLIRVGGQPARPFDLLSAGEQLWSGLAFQMALAIVSGLGFVALDAAEAVVGRNRGLLTDLVMAGPVDQVVVAMAKGSTDPDPVVAGLTVVRLTPIQATVDA